MSPVLFEERPPTAEEVEDALKAYVAAVKAHYGGRLQAVNSFGSRARGDAHPESDADIAVIIEGGDWNFWSEKIRLAGLAYEPLIEFGLYIQPWPFSLLDWEEPKRHRNPRFVENAKRDARLLEVLA